MTLVAVACSSGSIVTSSSVENPVMAIDQGVSGVRSLVHARLACRRYVRTRFPLTGPGTERKAGYTLESFLVLYSSLHRRSALPHLNKCDEIFSFRSPREGVVVLTEVGDELGQRGFLNLIYTTQLSSNPWWGGDIQ